MSKRSRRWLAKHQRDEFSQRSRDQGFRSRAAYKLLEVDQRDSLLRPGMTVVDLGGSPGSWSQVAASRVLPGGRVVSLDLLPMQPIAGVEFILGDFREPSVLDELLARLERSEVGLIISDMAPNATGIRAVDQPRAMYLSELALDFCRRVLIPGGDFLVKVFEGSGKDQFVNHMRGNFGRVLTRKPKASRPGSREVYLLGRRYIV